MYLAVWGKRPFFLSIPEEEGRYCACWRVCVLREEDSPTRKIGDRDPYLRPPKNAGQFSIAGFFGD